MTVSVGFFGKIPARGDFLRYRLPDATVQVLDTWIARNLGPLQQAHGGDFDLLWERAPIWRFSLDAGRLDPALAASGIWMPSIDRAGRCFPLMLVTLHPPGWRMDALLDALLPAMQNTVQWDAPPDALQAAADDAAMRAGPAAGRVAGDVWHRPALHDGSPVVLRAALPDADGFGLLLRPLPQEVEALSEARRS